MRDLTPTGLLALPPSALAEYQAWLGTIKQRIVPVRLRMGVSEYTLVEALPDNLKGALPTVEEIESDLQQLQVQSVAAAESNAISGRKESDL